jgi:hypothetical protein
MSTRALTLAIHLLGAAAVGVALPSTGCLLFCGGWGDIEPLELGVSFDLHAVAALPYEDDTDRSYEGLAVGAAGKIVVWGFADEMFVEVSTVAAADLRAISAEPGSWWVVGDAGTAAVSGDRGQTWLPVELPTSANLHAIARVGSQLIVAGDEIVLVQDADGTWSETLPPGDSWGQLRALYSFEERLYAVGLGGVIWSTDDPRGEWVAEASGTQVDLFAIGDLYFHREAIGQIVVVVGADGTVLVRKPNGWDRISNTERVDLVGYSNGRVLGANGELFDINSRGKLSHVDTFAGARAIGESTSGAGVVAVGDEGAAFLKQLYYCEGRPFIVDGQPHTAALRHDGRWCDATPSLAHTLAAAWARDGLYEHASIASFARFALELLALGAPPRLLRDLHAAIDDELRHTRACFELARRFGGVELSPGPMPMPTGALARLGDPIATALGLFDEACVNESVAACAAAEAAARSDDPDVRRTLETIAADERRHAIAGWAALRWLLETYGDQVRQPLRVQLARLRPTTVPHVDDFDDALRPFGRLSARDQASLRNEVLAQLVRPLARAMLFANTPAHTESSP